MLYFLGYSLSMVFTANLVMYVCYVGLEVAYFSTSYMLAGDGVRKRLGRHWWMITIMPLFRFTLFWFRFGGFLSVLTEPAEWKVKDPLAQVCDGFARLKYDFNRGVARMRGR